MIWLVLLCFSVSGIVASPTDIKYAPTVTIKSGPVRGLVETIDGEDVYFYQGIRFGTAKRFEHPTPVTPWTEVYDATNYRDACPQFGKKLHANITGKEIETPSMSEDCLFLNVWQPKKPKDKRPVMVWIHGGGYQVGTIFTSYYNGDVISKMGDTIVVSLNYRLNLFGFLYAGESEQVPGNAGLYDQLLGHKWVQENIHKFGGDPKQVTIFGESSGSFSVGSLVISPLAKGLFHRAIMQSGSPASYFGFTDKKTAVEISQKVAKLLNCPPQGTKAIIDCLKEKSVVEIVAKMNQSITFDTLFVLPIIEDNFLPIRPQEALKNGKLNKVDILFGSTRDEGATTAVSYFPILNPNIKHPNLTIPFVKASIRKFLLSEPEADKIVEFYTKDLNDSNIDGMRRAISNSFGDYYMACPTVLFGEEVYRHFPSSKLYSYRMMFPQTSFPTGCTGWMGVCHGTDVFFMFGQMLKNPSKFPKAEVTVSRDMVNAWTSFANTGTIGKIGNTDWKAAFESKDPYPYVQYMSLDPNNYKMSSDHDKEVCQIFFKPILMR